MVNDKRDGHSLRQESVTIGTARSRFSLETGQLTLPPGLEQHSLIDTLASEEPVTENIWRWVVDNIQDMVFIMDCKGRFALYNHAVTAMLRLPERDIIGKNMRDLGFSRDTVRKWNILLRQATEGKKLVSEISLSMPDGRVHLYEITLYPMKNEQGEIIGCSGVSHDITEIRQAREALRQVSLRLLETQEKERRAIGEVLHDELGASLTMLNLSLHHLKKEAGPQARPAIKEFEDAVRDVIEQVRALSHSLRPSVLGQVPLEEALQLHIQRFEARTGMAVRFQNEGVDGNLPSEIEIVIYRIVQEALTNAAKYSGAEAVGVVLYSENNTYVISIEDNGKGFDPRKVDSEGSGIIGMQDLAALIGGELSLDSSPGYGTRITCRIPLPEIPDYS